MEQPKLCPLQKMKPCQGTRCAWWYSGACAVTLPAWIDHTHQLAHGLTRPAKEE